VPGWFADLLRLAWGLLYWNTRKSWFRLRRGRSECPCQSPSDSGRAYETGCEASLSWNRQARFRRLCPLLVETPQGLRCAANTADVRPFWGVAARYFGGAALSLYVASVLAVFIFLRTVGYPVSIVHVGLPPLWHKVGQARGWFFLDQSNRAFAAGRTAEGLLALANAYEFDPGNYEAGIALAKKYQAGQPARSDVVFRQLLSEHPDKRHATAQDWFRALLARGNFAQVAMLAHEEILMNTPHAGVWMRALLFATRRTRDDALLHNLVARSEPAARAWHPLLEAELLLRSGRTPEARAALERPWVAAPPFALFHRVNALIELGDAYGALDFLARHAGVLDAEATVTLRLAAFAAQGAATPLARQVDELLGSRLNPATVKILCAQLIRFPNPNLFARLWEKVSREEMPFNTVTAGAWFSLLGAAGAMGDKERLSAITTQLKGTSKNPFIALNVVESFFLGETAERRITAFLPILPLPLEVTYALLDRYLPPPVAAPATPERA